MRKYVKPLAVAVIALVALVTPIIGIALSAAASPSITEYTSPFGGTAEPDSITSGSDGALWFVDQYTGEIGRVTTSGSFTEYTKAYYQPQWYNPTTITSGPDGALWFTDTKAPTPAIGRFTTSASFSKFSLSDGSIPSGITSGPDGNVWFTDDGLNQIGTITTSGDITEYPLPSGSLNPGYLSNITSGPDGALWFTEPNVNRIGRITLDGAVTVFSTSLSPRGITTGPDGAIWFTEISSNPSGMIGHLTTSGQLTEYSIPSANAYPFGNIATGPDGALWFADTNNSKIDKITITGQVTEYPTPTSNSDPAGITVGSDGNIWFTETNIPKIGKLVLLTVPSAPANLAAPSPSQNPSLGWDAVVGNTSYNIYRNGTNIGSSSTTSYTDTTAPEGTDTYYVTAVNSAGESSPSNSVSIVVDRTPPTVSNVTLAQDPLATGSITSLSATVADNLSGVAKAEYYIGTDPGQGNGTPMTMTNGTASVTVGPFSSANIYTIYIRSQDNAGNWSQPMPVNADVYNPSGGYTAGHGFITPNGATSNPGDNLPTMVGPNVKATLDFTVKYASSTSTTPTGDSSFTWGSGNCKKANNSCFVVTADTSVNPNALSWLVLPGDNTATFQGLATVSLNGQTLGTNYVMRVSIIATTSAVPGHYKLQVYQAGSDPDTATPLYQASGDLTGGAVLLH